VAKRNRNSAAKAAAPAASADEDNPLDEALAKLRATISAGEVLDAELQTSALIALLYMTDGAARETGLLTDVFVEFASKELHGPEGAAYLRLLMSLGPRTLKRKASEALAELTADGVYPPEWVTSIGRPTPSQAWRLYDVTGDREVIAVTYRYEDAEHTLLFAIDLVELPVVGLILVGDDAHGVKESLGDHVEPWERYEQITVAEARRHIEPALARAEEERFLDPDETSILFLPLARSRVRRLPSDDAGKAVGYTAADRAAAVDEFLRSADGADAGDPETARFWAQVLTGYSSRVPGEPPAQVGPTRLAAMLLVHVPRTFTLSAGLRDGLGQALTAWVRWAVGYQGLDEAAAEHLTERVPQVLADFQAAYDDPFSVAEREYVRDLVAGDTDLAWLGDQRARREFAVPLPDDRAVDDADVTHLADVADIDATDPDGRAVVTAAEFAHCGPEGAERAKFVAAATRVVEEIWNDEPAQTWREAKRLAATGLDRHDVIHALAGDDHGARA
jgi:hypothetical protein